MHVLSMYTHDLQCTASAFCQGYNYTHVHYTFLSSCRLRKEYEAIADKALTTPTDTEHLMALTEEIATVVEKTLPELETRIVEARHRYTLHCTYM